MPRVPSVFEKKLKYRRYDESEFSSDVSNYKSASGPHMSAVLTAQFQEEAALGFMYKEKLSVVKKQIRGCTCGRSRGSGKI